MSHAVSLGSCPLQTQDFEPFLSASQLGSQDTGGGPVVGGAARDRVHDGLTALPTDLNPSGASLEVGLLSQQALIQEDLTNHGEGNFVHDLVAQIQPHRQFSPRAGSSGGVWAIDDVLKSPSTTSVSWGSCCRKPPAHHNGFVGACRSRQTAPPRRPLKPRTVLFFWEHRRSLTAVR